MEPVYIGMPPTERILTVKKREGGSWGRIICGGACRDDYTRIVQKDRGSYLLRLQKAAMTSYLEAEDAVGFEISLTGSWRSCEQQERLYKSDSKRFANPDTTGHTRGLCIDVSMALSPTKREKIKKALLWRSWYQSRPDDEPWHYSFGIQV